MTTTAPRPTDGSGQMFDRIASRYDLVNRVMSFGTDRAWRRQAVEALALAPGARVLDLATGTGDLALAVVRRYATVQVVGIDPSVQMLSVGRQKVTRAGLAERVELRVGDAQELPFEAATFDAACMAFGIRNVPDRDRALREIGRVLRPGGRCVILELSDPRGRGLGSVGRFYVHRVVPWIGALLSGAQEYRYLERSIAAFPSAPEFTARLESAGFRVDSATPLAFGAAHIFVATTGDPLR